MCCKFVLVDEAALPREDMLLREAVLPCEAVLPREAVQPCIARPGGGLERLELDLLMLAFGELLAHNSMVRSSSYRNLKQ